jgi:hypothetical protein
MNCRLCLGTDALCDSHIVPEFFYKPIYDEKHRFFVISSDPETKDRALQKGIREPLLCQKCETKLSRFEKYFSEILHGGRTVEASTQGSYLCLRGLDYPKTKLMFMSVLWRMSISTHEMFSAVKLGPYEEPLRQQIENEDPGEPAQFGFLTTAVILEGKPMHGIGPPDMARLSRFDRVYRVVLGGLLVMFIVPGKALNPDFEKLFLDTNGQWLIKKERAENIKFLREDLTNLAQGINARS